MRPAFPLARPRLLTTSAASLLPAILAAALCTLSVCARPALAQAVPANRGAASPRVPYTAEFKVTRVQTLANGTTISHETRVIEAQDSSGRRMTSTTQIPSSDERPVVTHVSVNDPTLAVRITWNSLTKEARVIQMPRPGQTRGCWTTADGGTSLATRIAPQANTTAQGDGGSAGATGNAAPARASGTMGSVFTTAEGAGNPQSLRSRNDQVRQDLGVDTIMGVEAHGYRDTRTTPAGMMGNDQPLVRTDETWWASGVGLMVRQITEDPQFGATTRELVNLDLNEPDPSTFQPPEGYEAVNEEMRQVPCAQSGAQP